MTERASGTVSEAAGQTPSGTDEAARMDKIRALLFGGRMRDLERGITDLGARLRDEAERLRQEQNERLAKLESYVRSELERLGEQHHNGRQEGVAAHEALAARLDGLERELRDRIVSLDDRLAGELLALRGELRDQAGEQLDQVRRTRGELTDALDRERHRLQDEKTGREELAQLFTELGLRLRRELELPQP